MVRKNINFKRAKYYAAAAVLLTSSMPVVPFSNAFADSTPLTQNLVLDSDVDECYTVEAGQNISVDLSGHTITCNDNTNSAFVVEAGGKLTISDTVGGGKVIASAATGKKAAAVLNKVGGTVVINGGEFSSSNWYTVKNFGTMTINGGTFTADSNNGENASLIANGWYNGAGTAGDDKGVAHPSGVIADLTINDGTFNHYMTTLTMKGDDYSRTEINGGTFTSSQGNLVMAAGTVYINGGVYTGYNHLLMLCSDGTDMDPGVAEVSGEGLEVNAAYLAKTSCGSPNLTVNSGVFNLTDGVFDSFTGTASFTGGVFSQLPSSDYLTIPDNNSIYQNADGTYEIATSPDLSGVPARIIVEAGEPVPMKDTLGLDDYIISHSDFSDNRSGSYSDGNYTFPVVGTYTATIAPRIFNTDGTADRTKDKTYKVHAYSATELGNQVLSVGSTYTIPEGTVEVDATYDAFEYGIRSDSTETVATLEDGIVTAVNPGVAELYATISIPAVPGETVEVSLGNVYVYSFDSIDDAYLIQSGADNGAQVLVDGTWAASAESDSENVSITNTGNTFDVIGVSAGLSNVSFSATVAEQQKSKTAKFYVYDVNDTDLVLKRRAMANSSAIAELIDKGHDDVSLTAVSTSDRNIVSIGRDNVSLTAGRTAGNATVKYRLAVGDKTADVDLNVHVYRFMDTMANRYDLGNDVTETSSFRVYDENADIAEITYSIKDESGNSATDVVVNHTEGTDEYSISLGENARPGSYTVEFKDTIMNGKAVETASTTVRVHSVEITSTQPIYIVLSHELSGMLDNYATISAESNFVSARNLSASVTSATTVGGISTMNLLGTLLITGNEAGSYEVKVSDGYASATAQVYVIDFTFGQDEYYVKRNSEEPYVLVNAINNYWHEKNVAEGRVDTSFKVVKNSDGQDVTAAFKSTKIEPTESPEGEDYEFWWCKSGECLEAGDYTVYYNANANGGDVVAGGKTATKSIELHIYEMVVPEYDTVYLDVNERTTVDVGDKNDSASIRASVTSGSSSGISFGGSVFNRDYTRITGRTPGVYTVTYRDLMGNGQEVGTFDLRVVVIEVEEDTILVRKGEKVNLTGSSAWTLSGATDTTTETNYTSESTELEIDTTDFAVGEHEFEIFHDFNEFAREGESPVRRLVKRTNVVVYELKTDETVDPAGATTGAIQDFLDTLSEEGLAETLLESRSFRLRQIANRDDAQALFGTNDNEAFNAIKALRDAINDGETIKTVVSVRELGEDDVVDERLENLIALMTTTGVRYFDVSILVKVNGETIAYLHTLNEPLTVYLADAEAPAPGYTREYVVLTQHGDEDPVILEEGTDFFIIGGKIYIVSSVFSTYSLVYNDTLIPEVPDTGVFATAANSEDGATMSSIVTAILVVTVSAIIALVGAVKYCTKKH